MIPSYLHLDRLRLCPLGIFPDHPDGPPSVSEARAAFFRFLGGIGIPQASVKATPVGSRTIEGADVCETTDFDFAVFCENDQSLVDVLREHGFCVSEDYVGGAEDKGEIPFTALRWGLLNLIVYGDTYGFQLFCRANEICRRLKVTDKGDRVNIFTTILENRRHTIANHS